MTPKALADLAGDVMAANLSSSSVLPMQIADGFEALRAKKKRSMKDNRLLFELSVGLSVWRFRGLGEAALTTMGELIEAHGMAKLRP